MKSEYITKLQTWIRCSSSAKKTGSITFLCLDLQPSSIKAFFKPTEEPEVEVLDFEFPAFFIVKSFSSKFSLLATDRGLKAGDLDEWPLRQDPDPGEY